MTEKAQLSSADPSENDWPTEVLLKIRHQSMKLGILSLYPILEKFH